MILVVFLCTLEFRGEALNALCALASITVITRHRSDHLGTKLRLDHSGNIIESVSAARSSVEKNSKRLLKRGNGKWSKCASYSPSIRASRPPSLTDQILQEQQEADSEVYNILQEKSDFEVYKSIQIFQAPLSLKR
ncbi:unnamed protein product [Haemonchus placei]|uniref:Uncharacterized protein n=1 Tax=Haemonchus placei TaxID=6290 RepID=A0A0N4XB51_HAEPC|nr:unnamed protein product [Haemonchus placei]